MKRIVKAAWVWEGDGTEDLGLRQGSVPSSSCASVLRPESSVLVDAGRILAVGDSTPLARSHPDAILEDLGDVILLPGLVNAHTHLELSDSHAGPSPTSGFAAWLLALVSKSASPQIETTTQHAISTGVAQCLRFGVTSVGDISRQCGITRPLLAPGPLRVTSYGEIQAMAQRRTLLDARLAAAADETHASPHLRIGLTPHAPYTVEPPAYRRCLEYARSRAMPLATHLAESPDEAAFLAEGTGPFRELWERIGAWDDAVPRFDGGPIRFAKSLGLLDYPTLLAHVNYCDDDELALLAAGRASVVYCPRTHRYFGHPPHRFRDMLAAGINVAVGTDSCASSPDLNLVDDLRLIHETAPEFPVEKLWRMATVNAARAIEARHVGTLAAGNFADLVAFPAEGDDPLRAILESNLSPVGVWIGGVKMPP